MSSTLSNSDIFILTAPFNRQVAIVQLGINEGMKLVVLPSYPTACVYFTREYMAGNVSVPQLHLVVQKKEK